MRRRYALCSWCLIVYIKFETCLQSPSALFLWSSESRRRMVKLLLPHRSLVSRASPRTQQTRITAPVPARTRQRAVDRCASRHTHPEVSWTSNWFGNHEHNDQVNNLSLSYSYIGWNCVIPLQVWSILEHLQAEVFLWGATARDLAARCFDDKHLLNSELNVHQQHVQELDF